MTDDQIRAVFLANGFTVKEGQTDLKPYVYAAARALLALATPAPAQPEPKGTTLDEKSPVKSPAEGAQEDKPVLEDDLAHEAEMSARAAWREGADLDDIELDELDEPYEEEECSRCRGDGRDPWNDYLLPCPECQGEQQP